MCSLVSNSNNNRLILYYYRLILYYYRLVLYCYIYCYRLVLYYYRSCFTWWTRFNNRHSFSKVRGNWVDCWDMVWDRTWDQTDLAGLVMGPTKLGNSHYWLWDQPSWVIAIIGYAYNWYWDNGEKKQSFWVRTFSACRQDGSLANKGALVLNWVPE